MFENKILRLVTLPLRIVGLLTPSRVRRALYYIRAGRADVAMDRLSRLLRIGRVNRVAIALYPSADRPGHLAFPEFAHPLVSIVIPVYNQWETTRSCLISILENTQGIAYEVIVGDDGSTDETRNLPEHASNVKRLVQEKNQGFLLNCNSAALEARGKYLLFLNNDTNVQPGWLANLLDVAEKDDRVGLVGPMLLYPDGRLQEAGGIIWRDASGWNYGNRDYPERPEYNYLKEADYISGACIMVRRSVWDEIGGFDERFVPAYYEDTDLAFEARRRGYKVIYQPQSRVVHLEGISHGTDLKSGIKSYQKANQAAFRKKWATALEIAHGSDPRDLFRARDRSFTRKHVLFIDHYVPLRDQDAGSKSTFQYLQLMTEMGYQITFLGDNFVDYQPYTSELQQMGIEVLYGSGFHRHWKRWLEAHGKDFDYVYLSRPHIAPKYLAHVRRHSSAKVLYCGHDLHYLREERHYELSGKRLHIQVARKWARIEEDILRQVDMAYFFSAFEIEEVNHRFPGVTVRTIPLYLFDEMQMENNFPISFDNREGLLFVGGFMHAPNVDAVQWFIEKVLPLVLEHLPKVVLTVVGSNPPDEISRLASDQIHITGRISDEALLQHYQPRTIGRGSPPLRRGR